MTAQTQKLSFLNDQKSVPAKQLHEPAPTSGELDAILQAAMSAPDHGSLTPYRFLIISGHERERLAEVFAEAAHKRGLDEAAVQKQRAKPMRSPLIVTVIATIQQCPGIPEIEQMLCAGAATQHIQLACRALGYGSIWLTGDNSYDLHVYQSLGLDINERIIGFIYIGTPEASNEVKIRTPANKITQYWRGPQITEFAI
jgi:nitroreductase